MTPQDAYIALPTSIRLHYLDWRGSGRPLILLHGLASSCRIWDLTAPILAQRFHVFALDQRGHGLSDKPGSYTFELHNEGAQTHSLEIEGNGIEKKGPQITFGQKGSFTVELKKSGKYEMYCPVDSHKSLGMTGTITVS